MRLKKAAAFILAVFITAAVLSAADGAAVPLPDGYQTVRLGMTSAETKTALSKYAAFGYRGERDVSLLPGFDRLLIETKGDGFLEECWFQFFDDSLYTITINLNLEMMDYYSVFRTLCQKYGNPASFSPDKALWKDDNVEMCLEKPLALKYSDVKTLNRIQNNAYITESTAEQLREEFLNSL